MNQYWITVGETTIEVVPASTYQGTVIITNDGEEKCYISIENEAAVGEGKPLYPQCDITLIANSGILGKSTSCLGIPRITAITEAGIETRLCVLAL